MQKLLRGILDFREKLQPGQRETFARLALGQQPDALFVACSDSRVVPNLFASTEPGDLFVVRNVGNLVPPCDAAGRAEGDGSEIAALEFAMAKLPIRDLIVCGHSECGAMQAIASGELPAGAAHLASWLRHGKESLARLDAPSEVGAGLSRHNRLSQLNVLAQLEHLRSYPVVRERLEAGALELHGWWFDIGRAEVSRYSESRGKFVVIDAAEVARLSVPPSRRPA